MYLEFVLHTLDSAILFNSIIKHNSENIRGGKPVKFSHIFA